MKTSSLAGALAAVVALVKALPSKLEGRDVYTVRHASVYASEH